MFFSRLWRQAAPRTVNNVTLVGVVHDIQNGFVFENAVTQFTLTTTSLDTTSAAQECLVEKDHHTIRCFGEAFSAEVKGKIKEGNVICINGKLRLNPQLESSCNKYFYFPYVHVEPPFGSLSIVHGDRRKPPETVTKPDEVPATPVSEAKVGEGDSSAAPSASGEESNAKP
jgi:hypothetical protein